MQLWTWYMEGESAHSGYKTEILNDLTEQTINAVL